MSRGLLITVFVFFVVNLGEAFGFLDISAAKCSPSCSPNIIQIINVPEEIKVIDPALNITINNKCSDITRFRSAFTTCNGFFNKQWFAIRRHRQWIVESSERHAYFYDGRSASANIIYGTINLMRYGGAAIGEIWSRAKFFQINRMHPESWFVSGDKFLLDKLNTFFSGIGGFLC